MRKTQATVGNLIDALNVFDHKLPIAIEDGEFGPLLAIRGVVVYSGKAQHPSWKINKEYNAVIVGHKSK